MPERLNGALSKSAVPLRVPRVRISLPPLWVRIFTPHLRSIVWGLPLRVQALIVQWIERRFPEPKIHVRFVVGAHSLYS